MEKERTSVLLDREVMLKLQAISRKTNKSRTFLINEAVTEYVTRKSPGKKLGIIGIVDSKDPDFAAKDERFLEREGFGED